jgi:protein involved in polysaccharide export with SLBB domain
MMFKTLRRLSVGALFTAIVYAPAAAAQSNVAELESRDSLVAELKRAESANRTQEAWLLKTRLEKGDFQDGDRIVVKLLGATQLIGWQGDTITVRSGRKLPFPQMDDLPLTGVLRSELTSKISSHLAKYVKDSSVRATPLVRLAVLGQVRAPNYYYTSTDVLLSDLVVKAGGPNPNADVNNIVIRRGGEVIWNAQDTRTALADGISIERLHLRAGDELYLDEITKGFDWRSTLQYAVPLVSLLFSLRYAFR